jgi:cell division protein FtsZ
MHGAKGVLMNIKYGGDLGIFEIQQAAAYIEEIISEDATFVWGCAEDSDMEGSVEIVIVATGFEEDRFENSASRGGSYIAPQRPVLRNEQQRPFRQRSFMDQPEEKKEAEAVPAAEVRRGPSWLEQREDVLQETEAFSRTAGDELDEPTFLRRGKAQNRPETD